MQPFKLLTSGGREKLEKERKQLQTDLVMHVEMMHAYNLIRTPYIVFLSANCNISLYKYSNIMTCCY